MVYNKQQTEAVREEFAEIVEQISKVTRLIATGDDVSSLSTFDKISTRDLVLFGVAADTLERLAETVFKIAAEREDFESTVKGLENEMVGRTKHFLDIHPEWQGRDLEELYAQN